MQVSLTIVAGTDPREIKLKKLPYIIGRGEHATLKVPSSQVSRQHAMIYPHEDQLLIRDMESTNGTILNGDKIELVANLHDGDEVEIGPVTFRINCDIPAADPMAPVVAPIETAEPVATPTEAEDPPMALPVPADDEETTFVETPVEYADVEAVDAAEFLGDEAVGAGHSDSGLGEFLANFE